MRISNDVKQRTLPFLDLGHRKPTSDRSSQANPSHSRHPDTRDVGYGGTSQSASLGLDGCQGFWAHPWVLESVPRGLAVERGWLGQCVLLGRRKQLLLISFSCPLLFHADRVFKDCLCTLHVYFFSNCSSQPQLRSTQLTKWQQAAWLEQIVACRHLGAARTSASC